MNEGYKARGALRSAPSNRGSGDKCEEVSSHVIVPTALFVADPSDMGSAERSTVNLLEKKCMISFVSVAYGRNFGINRCVEKLEWKGSWLVEWI